MVTKRNLKTIMHGYDEKKLSIGSLGSHSALDVAEGASLRGVHNFVVALLGREMPYTIGFKKRLQGQRAVGCVDEVKVVGKWTDILTDRVIKWMRERNGVLIPNRSLAVYLRDEKVGSYDRLLDANIPFYGNINLLQAEERTLPFKIEYDQDFLAEKAGLPVPERFFKPEQINKPVLVKAAQVGTQRNFERNFIVVNSAEEYFDSLQKFIDKVPKSQKAIAEKTFLSAPIQEYLGTGSVINLNYFYSQIWDDLELLGTDTRTQFPSGEEATHIPISLRESLYQQALQMGYSLVSSVKKYYPQGLIGPFAIQCIGDENERLRPIDLSFRIPGSPDVSITPPALYTHGRSVSFGERIAMELQDAVEQGRLREVLS